MTAERRFRAVPIAYLTVGLLMLVLLGACKSQAQIDRERATLAGTPLPTATIAAASSNASPEPSTVVATEDASAVRYVANTGGDGISLRSDCRADARVAGAWTEGTEVEVIEQGAGDCDGWTLASVGSTETWVSNRYLSVTSPPIASGGSTSVGSTPAPSIGTPSPTATTPPVTVSGAPGEFAPGAYEFVFDQYGFPNLVFTVHNQSNATIVEFVVDICLFDPEGVPVKQHDAGSNCFRSTHDDVTIAPGGSPGGRWNLAFERAAAAPGPALDVWAGTTDTVIPETPTEDGRCYVRAKATEKRSG